MNEKGDLGMSTEDYVSFECAKLLKEKGFDEPCIMFYIDTEKVPVSDIIPFNNPKNWNERDGRTSAPTLWQAAKWLRDEKALFINLGLDTTFEWWYEVEILGVGRELDNGSGFDSYESALSAGIEAALKLI